MVNSLSKRTTLGFLKDFVGRSVAEAFAGSMIDLSDYGRNLLVADLAEARSSTFQLARAGRGEGC